ncbi:DUF2141 domain-containing protein [Plastoroseomonas hellenica]|nr:DUF2141 domain-containing protein [Plastoroseomonas hellenica]
MTFLLAAAMPTGAQPAATVEQRATLCSAADAPAGPRLAITITNARNAMGEVVVTLYGADPRAFLEQRIALAEVPIQGNAAQVCFALSTPGDYAVSVFHDENNDHILNRTLLGLPEEGFGFSNDAPVRLGPPSFRAARVAVPPSGGGIAIRLRYF